MNILEKINRLMEINEIRNLHLLSQFSGIPYSTYRNYYLRGTNNMNLDTAQKICDFFDITLDEFVRDEISLPEFIKNDDKNSVLKVKRKYPKPDYSEKTRKNEEAFKVASKYENEVIDLSQYDEDTKDLILKIIEMNKKQKKK